METWEAAYAAMRRTLKRQGSIRLEDDPERQPLSVRAEEVDEAATEVAVEGAADEKIAVAL